MTKKKQSKTQPRETVGQTVYDNLLKQPDMQDIRDLRKPLLNEYQKDLIQSVQNSLSHIFERTFYVEVVFIREKPLQGMVLHPRFFTRSTCPTPTWGQHVWEYDSFSQKLDLFWAIPFKEECERLKREKDHLTDGEKVMLNEVLQFEGGLYEKVARKLNNEPKEGCNIVLTNEGVA